MTTMLSPEDAMLAIQTGRVPDEMVVTGDLRFYQQEKIAPPKALPASLTVDDLIIHDASLLTAWPRKLRCKSLYLWNLTIPIPAEAELYVENDLNIKRCTLTDLSALRVGPRCEVDLRMCENLRTLPPHLTLATFTSEGCTNLTALPADMQITGQCSIRGSPRLRQLPQRIYVTELRVNGSPLLTDLPEDCTATSVLDLTRCSGLRELPASAAASTTVVLNDCTSLVALPPRMTVRFLSIVGCHSLTQWDDPSISILGKMDARDCHNLSRLPPNLHHIDELDVSGCGRLAALPSELQIAQWVDIGGTAIRALPPAVTGTAVRWHGVEVPGRVAFHPTTITAAQVLNEQNAEVRRVMLERMGLERFIAEAQPTVRDTDRDHGGSRRLLQVAITDDEPLVTLQVRDPSTGKLYLLRVPPTMQTCHQAAAWIAGFDNPDDYHPVIEA
ncbi:MAG: hypothetical protein H0X24_13765 [Ktedonobacterales bacterium]|nr:hypothetical protein [Ktedonobacterales bacterium]